jgi:uncharacterized SAM-binding protein YcdF (DUF218 family)
MMPIAVFGLLAFGSIYPHYSASRFPQAGKGKTDAVFVLAGGENRIVTGLDAFRNGMGDQLFILGTGHSASPESILPGYADYPAELKRRIHIEGWSETTLENAASAKGIVAERKLRGIVLVTSDYHMPRAFVALRKAIPDSVRIETLAVPSHWKGGDARWRKIRLFLVESWKYWGYRVLLTWE